MSRGGFRGGIRPKLPEGKARENFTIRIKPETKAFLDKIQEESDVNPGRQIDALVLLAQWHPEHFQKALEMARFKPKRPPKKAQLNEDRDDGETKA